MGSIFSGLFDVFKEIIEIVVVIILFIIDWLTLAILGGVSVGSADDFRKKLPKDSEAREKADSAWETLKSIEWITWTGFVIMVLLLIAFVVIEFFGGVEVEGAAAAGEGGVVLAEGVEGAEGLVEAEEAATTLGEAGAKGAEELESQNKTIKDIFKKYRETKGKAKDSITQSKQKYNKELKERSENLTELALACKNGLGWGNFFANKDGTFALIRTATFWLSSIALFTVGVMFASAASNLSKAQKLADENN
jgi:ABC-type multidrug transport system fused ATPase/permease subunit